MYYYEKFVKSINIGDEVCFFEGRNSRPVAYTDSGKVIICKHKIPLGYAKIKSVEDKGKCFLVTADHIVKDIYSGIDYEDFIAALPLHGFKIGFDLSFDHHNDNNEVIREHQIYAYNLKNNVVIVAETFTWEGDTRIGFNSIDVYCPQVDVCEFMRCGYMKHGNANMTVFDLSRQNNGYDLLTWVNNIMEDVEDPIWPVNDYPSLYTYEDIETEDKNERKRHLHKLLNAPDSLQIFKGCKFVEKLNEEDESMKTITKSELFKRYGYLMDQEHGKDTELLMDIMKCNGIDVECKNGKYLVLDK